MEQTLTTAGSGTKIAVLADDLIWASRLRAAIEKAGAIPVPVKQATDIAERFAVIDLGGRAYDGVDAVRAAAIAGSVVLAVSQHEDVELRKSALAAGARRVLSYNKLFNDGPDVITRLIAGAL